MSLSRSANNHWKQSAHNKTFRLFNNAIVGAYISEECATQALRLETHQHTALIANQGP